MDYTIISKVVLLFIIGLVFHQKDSFIFKKMNYSAAADAITYHKTDKCVGITPSSV